MFVFSTLECYHNIRHEEQVSLSKLNELVSCAGIKWLHSETIDCLLKSDKNRKLRLHKHRSILHRQFMSLNVVKKCTNIACRNNTFTLRFSLYYELRPQNGKTHSSVRAASRRTHDTPEVM